MINGNNLADRRKDGFFKTNAFLLEQEGELKMKGHYERRYETHEIDGFLAY